MSLFPSYVLAAATNYHPKHSSCRNRDCFSHLRVLALNSCGLRGWAEVQLLDDFVPALEELYLSGNPLADLPRRQAALQTEAATGQPPSTDSVAGNRQLLFALIVY